MGVRGFWHGAPKRGGKSANGRFNGLRRLGLMGTAKGGGAPAAKGGGRGPAPTPHAQPHGKTDPSPEAKPPPKPQPPASAISPLRLPEPTGHRWQPTQAASSEVACMVNTFPWRYSRSTRSSVRSTRPHNRPHSPPAGRLGLPAH